MLSRDAERLAGAPSHDEVRDASLSLLNSNQSTSVMSPRLGTSGNLAASTAQGNGSISLNAIGSQPSPSHATLAPSMPLNRLTYLTPASPP